MTSQPPQRLTPVWLRPLAGSAATLAYASLLAIFAASSAPSLTLAPAAEVIMVQVGEATPEDRDQQVSTVETVAGLSAPALPPPPIVDPPPLEQPTPAQSSPPDAVPPDLSVPEIQPPILEPITRKLEAEAASPQHLAAQKSIELKRQKQKVRPKPTWRAAIEDDDDEEERARPPKARAAQQRRTAQQANSAPSENRRARSGASSGGAQASAASKAAYGAIVSAELNRHKAYPAAARASGATGAVSVVYAVGPSGRMASHHIVRSSGNAALDGAARAMFRAAHPPPPPGGSFRSSVTVHFNLVR